jgi:hypothetical protein
MHSRIVISGSSHVLLPEAFIIRDQFAIRLFYKQHMIDIEVRFRLFERLPP